MVIDCPFVLTGLVISAALRVGHTEVLKLLSNSKPEGLALFFSRNPLFLHQVCERDNVELAKWLINRGADILIKDQVDLIH